MRIINVILFCMRTYSFMLKGPKRSCKRKDLSPCRNFVGDINVKLGSNKRVCNNILTQGDLFLTISADVRQKYEEIHSLMHEFPGRSPQSVSRYFKTGTGEYAEEDKFIGLTNPTLRTLARQYSDICDGVILLLLASEYNEERHFALLVMTIQFNNGDVAAKNQIFSLYIKNLNRVNNWNLVDNSAYSILGQYLVDKKKDILIELAKSDSLWERRIAIVSTLSFIRMNEFEWTLKISSMLLQDPHPLIHRAVGWMLREVGKKDISHLSKFLEEHIVTMNKLTLSYAIEKMSTKVQREWKDLANRK